jgi:hypothetical protein
MAVAAAAGDDAHVVTSAGLWLFLFQPGVESEMNAERLAETITANGSALLAAVIGGFEWLWKSPAPGQVRGSGCLIHE